MKKIKLGLMTFVIIMAISGAVASAPDNDFCDINIQYYKVGFIYLPAGEVGYNYACIYTADICTYWRPNPVMAPDTYVPCKKGLYFPLL